MQILPGGEYGFYPQVTQYDPLNRATNTGVGIYAWIAGAKAKATYSHLSFPGTYDGGAAQLTVTQRYITSSGEVFWIFILRAKKDYTTINEEGETSQVPKGAILSMYQAPDHPCFGNGGKPLLVPHPFGSYDPETQEIIVINPSLEEVAEMELATIVEDETKLDRDLLEVITEDYKIDENSNPAWPDIPVTVGLPKDYGDKAMGDKVIPIKKVIPKPTYIKCKSLRKK